MPSTTDTKGVRIAATLPPIALLAQAVTAGLLLSVPGGRTAHFATIPLVLLTEVVLLVVALVAWRRSGSTPRLAVFGVLLLAVTIAEAVLGAAGVTALHVPLGALLLGVSFAAAATAWNRR
ncbi:hypothetical protein [Kribbella sp. HUAS MG21]|jgi:hypothetical protein|uniref:Integral membrane protein n=1 Tax=Kribbella sp. HUAS MG21 TaxID=3160966 RepID=A0AAU7T5P1_9ACTN